MVRSARVLMAVLVIGLLGGGCTQHNSARPDSPMPSTLTVGLLTDVPGSGTLETGTNKRTGFGYDLMNYLAYRMHFTPAPVDVTFGQREPTMRDGRVKVMLANFAITEARKKYTTFAGPYMYDHQGMLDRKADDPIETNADLRGKTVCTAEKTTSLDDLDKGALQGTIDIKLYPGLRQCVTDLQNGKVDAVATDQLDLSGFAKEDPSLRLENFTYGHQDEFAIGLPKGDLADCRRFTQQIQGLLSTDQWESFFKNNYPNVKNLPAHKPDPSDLLECRPIQ